MSESSIQGIAFSALTDPASLAVAAEDDLRLAEKLLSLQVKMHLLTSEHLLLSKGFLFDNPGIWRLLQEEGFVDVLLAKRGSRSVDGTTTLIIQANEQEQKEKAIVDMDSMFRLWAFGQEGNRMIRPSAPKILGSASHNPRAFFSRSDRASVTLGEYATQLGSSDLRNTLEGIRRLFEKCEPVSEPSDRYERFTERVRAFMDYVSQEKEEARGGSHKHLYPDLQNMATLLQDRTRISRSEFEDADHELWSRWAPHLNHIRMTAHYPSELASGSTSFLPDATNRIISPAQYSKRPDAKWIVALNKLTYKDVFAVRERPHFRRILERLGEASATPGEAGSEIYYRLLNEEWSPALMEALTEVASGHVVQKHPSTPEWVAPVAVSVATTVGYLILDHLGLSSQTAQIGALGTALAAEAQILIKEAVAISSKFQPDFPEGRAHLITHRLIKEIKQMKPVEEDLIRLKLSSASREKNRTSLRRQRFGICDLVFG